MPEPVAKRHLWSGAKFLAKSARDNAVDHAWLYIWGAVVTFFTGAAIYIWSGAADWAIPYLLWIGAYAAGVFSLVLVILIATLIRLRREQLLERARLNKFRATEKVALDHWVDYAQCQKDFPLVLQGIKRELNKIAKIIDQSTFSFWRKFGAKWGRNSLSQTASRLNACTVRMEKHAERLDAINTTFGESVTFVIAAGEFNPKSYPNMKVALGELFDQTIISHNSLFNFREAQFGARRQSIDLDTALNHMTFVTDKILSALNISAGTWTGFINILDSLIEENGGTEYGSSNLEGNG